MTNTPQTFLDIHHPAFRRGYQKGRQHSFREQTRITDKQLVEYLQEIFKESEQDKAHDRDETVYYAVAHLVGQMSTRVIPRQPHEDNAQEIQEAFLVKIAQQLGSAGRSPVEMIQQFWDIQDQLAQMLDADTFAQVLNRGAERGSL